jgi:hypothetical protein
MREMMLLAPTFAPVHCKPDYLYICIAPSEMEGGKCDRCGVHNEGELLAKLRSISP